MIEISVIIPVYNAAEFLEKAVKSAAYFDEVKEIILAEDQSTDHSLEICRRLVSEIPKVKLFQHPNGENRGAGASRNLGIDHATSDFIAFLDADDYYLPNRFDAEKTFLQPCYRGRFRRYWYRIFNRKRKTGISIQIQGGFSQYG